MEIMEADKERRLPSSSSSAERRPLSDSTNTLVPVSASLRKLSSFLSDGPPSPNSIPKQKLNPKPKSQSKLYRSSASKPGNNPSKSDTSIGSSNYNDNTPNADTLLRPQPSTPPRVSTANFGNAIEDAFEDVIVYSRKQTAAKTKGKEKAVSVPFSSSLRTARNNAKADKLTFTGSLVEKAWEKEVKREKRKAVAVTPSFDSLGITNNERKAVSKPIIGPPMVKTRNRKSTIAAPFSCPPLSRTRKKCRNEFNEAEDNGLTNYCTVANQKRKKERYSLLPEQEVSRHILPQEFIDKQRAYFKEVDDYELPEEEVSEDELDKE
ncbi:hypothetical protein NMG60_11018329 [Bertholletia excelsa]